jgi:alpha-amylase/alpha-mannosidase (GH57 family)
VTEKLSVCFIWHMHQPLYKDRLSGLYLMPWVRLHGIKDYIDMPLILEEFPNIRQTFNLVPSLIEQLDDYAKGAVDEQLLVTCKDENEYTTSDKIFILRESFHCNLERQVKKFAPYFELWQKRERLIKKGNSHASMVDEFTPQEYADMATWFNIAWFDPMWVAKHDEIANYIRQGGKFNREQRERLIEIQREIIRETIPIYKRLQDKGQIEVTTTPYYHPILPLLIDTNAARWCSPQTALPEKLYFHREDARAQLDKGLKLYEERLGTKARGMWPSEMSVSPAALELISDVGIKWVVLDEALLCKSAGVGIYRDHHGNLNNPEVLCQPYKLAVGDHEISIVFREVVTSNEIGFSYGHRDPQEAATALYMRLKHIQQKLFHWDREGMVAIALDGENCWETYLEDGGPFLRELYERISTDSTLNVCTVSEYIEKNPPTTQLNNIHSGSWINADYHIWIGDPIKNRAWDLLGDTRNFLVRQLKTKKYPQDVQERAWEEIYTAEGSDWFWWFGQPNNSAHDDMFDEQFRLRLQNVYKLLGEPYPEVLDISVYEQVAPPVVEVEEEKERTEQPQRA